MRCAPPGTALRPASPARWGGCSPSELGLAAEGQVLFARKSEWRYLDDGSDPGASWKDPSFDDERWLRGKARLGYGGDGEATVVRFGPDPRKKYITTYFRASFDLQNP